VPAAREEEAPRILVVDDDPIVRRMVTGALARKGYVTEEAADGEEALRAIARRRPDALILDVEMPRLDGRETCRRLRARLETADLPILMLTSRDAVEDEVAGLEAGADDYLSKPVVAPKLLARLALVMARRAQRGEPPAPASTRRGAPPPAPPSAGAPPAGAP
jgi:DNA-binding response OmpR family regulator